jgi:predicted DNA-binding transcriptional regulator YafY
MARNEQLIRQHKILQILERNRFGATLDEIRDSVVDELGLTSIHPRSIRRDIEALQSAGFFIVIEESQRGKIWKMSRADKGLQKVSISASEVIALSVGRDLLLPLVGTQFWQGIESFWNKLQEQLPPGVFEHYEQYRKTLYVTGTPAKKYEKQQGILSTVNRAIREHRRLAIDYQRPGKPASKRKLEPYGLAIYQSSIYILAFEHPQRSAEARSLKHWKLDRILWADALDEWYKFDATVDMQQHLGQSIGIFSGQQSTSYRIRVSEMAAKWIEEDPWHAEQVLAPNSDGTVDLTIPAYHPLEVIQKVLQLGREAEVLEPESCRKMIGDMVREMARNYSTNGKR